MLSFTATMPGTTPPSGTCARMVAVHVSGLQERLHTRRMRRPVTRPHMHGCSLTGPIHQQTLPISQSSRGACKHAHCTHDHHCSPGSPELSSPDRIWLVKHLQLHFTRLSDMNEAMPPKHANRVNHIVTHTDTFVVGGAKRATCNEIRIGISAAALVRRGLRQPTHGLHGRPRETAQHRGPWWVADLCNPTARDHLWHPAARSVAPSAVVHLMMSLRSSHLIGDHLFDFGATAAAYACSLCQDGVFPSCPDFGSAPRAHADREHRWRHIEHLLFECPGILGTGGTLAVTLLRDDLFNACFGSDHASAVLLAAFPSDRTPVVAATACLAPFLLDPAAALGRPPPWRMKL